MRTTNSLESYNNILKKEFPTHGSFFHFLKCLRKEENIKSREFISIMEGSVNVYMKQRKLYENRDKYISQATYELEFGKITSTEFLRRMTYEGNKIITDMANYEDEGGDLSDDEYLGEQMDTWENDAALPLDESVCITCFINKKNILLQPCNHVKVCNECYDLLLKNIELKQEQLKCPYCRQVVSKAITIFI